MHTPNFAIHGSRKSPALLLLALLSASSIANAALSSRDLVFGTGDKLLTFDSGTQLEWLDVTQTLNHSFDNVVSQLGIGGQFAGFHVASTAQVKQLFLDGGWSGAWNTNYVDNTVHFAEASAIVGLLGRTTINYPNKSTYGMVSDAYIDGRHYYNVIYTNDLPFYSTATANSFMQYPNTPSDYIGTFLYRPTAPVPEPDTYAMLLAGLGLIGFSALRRQYSRRSA